MIQRIQFIDSHTGGEPTRVVIAGGPELGPEAIPPWFLGSGTMPERRNILREKYDWLRSAVVNEPRGSDVLVGALVCPPVDPSSAAGVIFFNNVGYLGMCGHGTIGVAVTLAHLGRIGPGTHRLETPVGPVTFDYDGGNQVSFENVPSFRLAAGVTVEVEGIGPITGDVAWGGNWFFLLDKHGQELELANVDRLIDFTWRIRQALSRNPPLYLPPTPPPYPPPGSGEGRAGAGGEAEEGADGQEIDHIELLGPPRDPTAHSRNFVLCPGKAYDRSPCGTGTSAKLACLIADGKLREGQIWRQESILGSLFEGSIRLERGQIIPRIKGSAFIVAEGTLILDPNDPFRTGIRP